MKVLRGRLRVRIRMKKNGGKKEINQAEQWFAVQTHPFANLVILAPLVLAHSLAFFFFLTHRGDLEGIGSMKHPLKALQRSLNRTESKLIPIRHTTCSTLQLRPPFTQVRCVSYSHLKVTIGTQQMCIFWV